MADKKKPKKKKSSGSLYSRAARSGLMGSRAKVTQEEKDKSSGYKKKKRAK
jgi:hypothetical protein